MLRAPICGVVAALPVLTDTSRLRSGSHSALQLSVLARFAPRASPWGPWGPSLRVGGHRFALAGLLAQPLAALFAELAGEGSWGVLKPAFRPSLFKFGYC